MEVTVGVSKRHVHLTKEVWEKLFGQVEMENRNNLGQPGQFATTSTVDLMWNNQVIEHVRVIGPIRKYNQVELAETDAKLFSIEPPRRQSGDLSGALPMEIRGPLGSVVVPECTILAEMHIHMTPEMAVELKLKDKELVEVYDNDKYLFDVKVKVSDPAALEFHIDTDESDRYNLQTGSIVDFKVCGK